MLKRSSHPLKFARNAFTLVELLVVFMILAILLALVGAALGPLLTNAKIAATQTTIAQLDDIIQQRAKAVAGFDLRVEAKRFANSSSLSAKEAEFIIRKNLMRQALPQRIEDVWGLDRDRTTIADNNPHLADWNYAPTTVPVAGQIAHSSEVLLWALTEVSRVRITADGKSFTVPTLELDNVNTNHLSSSPGSDTRVKFVDEWGIPLQFYTWSTRLVRPGGMTGSVPNQTPADITQTQRATFDLLVKGVQDFSGTLNYSGSDLSHPFNQDPHDPTGVLGDTLNDGNTFSYRVNGTSFTAPTFNEANYHTPNTMFFPLLVSGGPDESIGIALPIATGAVRHAQPPAAASLGDLTDNITNRQ